MDAEKIAQEVLEATWKEKGFPVDPVVIAHEFGVKVKEADLPEDISAALVKKKGEDTVILISSSDSKNRQRFSCAHEIGHYILRVGNNEEHFEFVDYRNGESSSGNKEDEIFANRFAACLLMPKDEMKRLKKKDYPQILMAMHFGVSTDAIGYRLMNI